MYWLIYIDLRSTAGQFYGEYYIQQVDNREYSQQRELFTAKLLVTVRAEERAQVGEIRSVMTG